MLKVKKILAVVLVLCLAFSVAALPASAGTTDKEHTFAWSGNLRTTRVRTVYKKDNNTATYFRTENNSMPVYGYYMKTTIGGSALSSQVSSSGYFLITTYGGKTIAHDTAAKGLHAGLEAHYPLSHYSWGNVTVAWSEDYVEDGSERLNW